MPRRQVITITGDDASYVWGDGSRCWVPHGTDYYDVIASCGTLYDDSPCACNADYYDTDCVDGVRCTNHDTITINGDFANNILGGNGEDFIAITGQNATEIYGHFNPDFDYEGGYDGYEYTYGGYNTDGYDHPDTVCVNGEHLETANINATEDAKNCTS